MKIITKSILTIATILFAGGCAATTPTISLVGTYEGKYEGSTKTARIELLENNVAKVYEYRANGKGESDSARWKVVDRELHMNISKENVDLIFKINPDGSVTLVSKDREDALKIGVQITFKKSNNSPPSKD